VAAVVGHHRQSGQRHRLQADCSPFLLTKSIGEEVYKCSINTEGPISSFVNHKGQLHQYVQNAQKSNSGPHIAFKKEILPQGMGRWLLPADWTIGPRFCASTVRRTASAFAPPPRGRRSGHFLALRRAVAACPAPSASKYGHWPQHISPQWGAPGPAEGASAPTLKCKAPPPNPHLNVVVVG